MSKVPRTPPGVFPPNPPIRTVTPETVVWKLVRSAGKHPLGWNQLRRYGPVSRFHPRTGPAGPSEEGSWYAADSIPTAFMEVYQQTRVIRPAGVRLCGIRLGRPVALLDLTKRWIVQAGASAALSSCDHGRSVAWAAALHVALPDVDGMWWRSAIDPEGHCLVLWENAADALATATQPGSYDLTAGRQPAAATVLAWMHKETGWPISLRI